MVMGSCEIQSCCSKNIIIYLNGYISQRSSTVITLTRCFLEQHTSFLIGCGIKSLGHIVRLYCHDPVTLLMSQWNSVFFCLRTKLLATKSINKSHQTVSQ